MKAQATSYNIIQVNPIFQVLIFQVLTFWGSVQGAQGREVTFPEK